MLIRVNTIHQPATLDEAVRLLSEDVRPLYGGVALHREAPNHVTAVVNLEGLGLDQHDLDGERLVLGSMLTLEEARQHCLAWQDDVPNAAFLAEMLRQEVPITLRNTMRLGDALIERKPNSPLLTALVALDAVVAQADGGQHPIRAWLAADARDVRPALITGLSLPRGTAQAKHAYQKVGRTPADDPIVGAVAYVETNGDQPAVRLALCGVDMHPVLVERLSQHLAAEDGSLVAALDAIQLNPPGDHWGSSEYRAAMGRLMARRVLEQALSGAGA